MCYSTTTRQRHDKAEEKGEDRESDYSPNRKKRQRVEGAIKVRSKSLAGLGPRRRADVAFEAQRSGSAAPKGA